MNNYPKNGLTEIEEDEYEYGYNFDDVEAFEPPVREQDLNFDD